MPSRVSRMHILQVHNSYRWPGGEDMVFTAESQLLATHGHDVTTYQEHNDRIGGMNRLHLASRTVWSRESRSRIGDAIAERRPAVCHFHNTFPLISPSAYYACRSAGIPVVQTLHNYRLACPGTYFYRDHQPCEDCAGTLTAWPGVVHGCYRQSRPASATVAAMLTIHRLLGTWRRCVDVYVALTEFCRTKFVENGLPADRIVVKPNFLPTDPGVGRHEAGYALFVGRLSPEKGVPLLLETWRAAQPRARLLVVGSGPLEPLLQAPLAGVEWMPQQTRDRVLELMQDAAFLIVPSTWYETFGLTIIEAFATGLPVIASRLGAMQELVAEGETGIHFSAGSRSDLAAKVRWALDHPAAMKEMGLRGRREYERKYTAARNYSALLEIYNRATHT